MTFLEIVRKANIFCGLQGGIDSVTYATGVQKTLVEFVNAAYLDIQLLRDNWAWMQKYTSSFLWGALSTEQVNAGVNKYVSLYNSENVDMTYVDYYIWLTSSSFTRVDVPNFFTIVPETNAVIVSPVNDTVTINYVAAIDPEELTTNTQVPKMPSRYHNIIVYKAAMEVASMLGNAEIRNENAARYDLMLCQLLRNQNLPLTAKKRALV